MKGVLFTWRVLLAVVGVVSLILVLERVTAALREGPTHSPIFGFFSFVHDSGPFVWAAAAAWMMMVVCVIAIVALALLAIWSRSWQPFRSSFGTLALVSAVVLGIPEAPLGTFETPVMALRGPGPHDAAWMVTAASLNSWTVISALMKKGVSVDARDDQGETALIAAAEAGNTRLARWLLTRGARVDAASDVGTTALLVAASNCATDTVEMLLGAGADPHRKDIIGRGLRERARVCHDPALQSLVERAMQ